MKKLTIKGVLDGIRGSAAQPTKSDAEIEENLRPEHFQVAKTVRHGFPHQPTALAYDPLQRLLAIGTKGGSLRIFGRPGVDCHVQHDGDSAIIQLLFLINEGALISVCTDDCIHLWNLRQKKPEIVHTLKFQRERITCCHLPFQSKWLYIGTERGNVHVANIESFVLSGYVINWNKAVELSRKSHPGCVIHLSDNPVDPNKLLVGFEAGVVVLWDLRSKTADARYNYSESLKSISWHHEGKLFMCSHTDGSLSTWNIRNPAKPQNVYFPHGKSNKDGKPEPCKPINKVEWKINRAGEAFTIFSGGLTYDRAGRTPSLTVIHGKATTVLEMEHNVIDFITLCETPWQSEVQEPFAVVVLLHNDLVVVDLTAPGYLCFENPYPMDLHESPVTCCTYLVDCPSDLIPAYYSVGSKTHKRSGFSDKEWPINGGAWGTATCSYAEVIITGHADGSLKFWDASAVSLQILYKLKTAKIFERPKAKSLDGQDDDPFAIHQISVCPESRLLCIAGASSHVALFGFSKHENTAECSVLEIPIIVEADDDLDCSPECEFARTTVHMGTQQGSSASSSVEGKKSSLEYHTSLKVRSGPQKRAAGYQPILVCLTPWMNGEPPGQITTLTVNSSYGLFAYGNEVGLVIVDFVQKTCLLSMSTPDLYGSADPYQRIPRSPKKNQENNSNDAGDRCRSPTSAEQINGVCVSPTTGKQQQRKPHTTSDAMKRTKSQDKIDSSFSRSRSSSMSSLENISSEAVQCLVFSDSFTKKTDVTTSSTLWVGTSLGSVLVIVLNLPPPELRQSQPVIVSPSGTIYRLKGAVQCLAFLDCSGSLIPCSYESWKDANKLDAKDKEKERIRTPTKPSPNNRVSPTSSQEMGDQQFAVITSEKQARVVALPSQTCAFKSQLTETSFVVKVDLIPMKDDICLGCYIANGHIALFSLPSLRILMDVEFVPLIDLRTARTFCFGSHGHGMYLCSPCEIQKFTMSSKFCENLQEMMGELFLPCPTREPPKEGFFKGLFGGGVRSLDREELFGEASGKPSRSIAVKQTPALNMEHLNTKMTGVTGEVARAHQGMLERGEHLSQLEERTQRMMTDAEVYHQTSHQLMLKYKDKKWYQF